jgi:hypothetical protein
LIRTAFSWGESWPFPASKEVAAFNRASSEFPYRNKGAFICNWITSDSIYCRSLFYLRKYLTNVFRCNTIFMFAIIFRQDRNIALIFFQMVKRILSQYCYFISQNQTYRISIIFLRNCNLFSCWSRRWHHIRIFSGLQRGFARRRERNSINRWSFNPYLRHNTIEAHLQCVCIKK